MRRITTAERRARLGRRHLLAGRSDGPVTVAGAMVGLHSSDPVTVYLSLLARVRDFTRGNLEAALYEDRDLLRMLGMRRTMFVVPRDLGAVVEAACTRLLAPAERRRLVKLVTDQGITDDGDSWVDAVCEATLAAIDARGEAVAADLRRDVPELALKIRFGEGKKWAGDVGVSTRVLFLLATEARIVRARPRGTWISSQYRWARTESWLGEPLPQIEKDAAQADLVTRWLGQFGPGTLTDVKWWTGWTVRDTKAALSAARAIEVELDEGLGYVLPDDLDVTTAPPPWAALLPGLDPTPMGWKERDWYLGGHQGELFDRNGNIGPSVWLNGRIVGGWGLTASGDVAVRLLEDVATDEANMIEDERLRVHGWLDGDRITPRFRTPLEKELAQ